MTKKRSKRSVPALNTFTHQLLYVKPATQEFRGIIFGLILCLVGGNLFRATEFDSTVPIGSIVLIGGLLLLGMLIILSTILWTLQSVTLADENLIFSYRAGKKVYKADEVVTIERTTTIDMGSSTGIFLDFSSTYRNFHYYPELFRSHSNQQYGRYLTLFVTLKNGEKLEIPDSQHVHIDVKRILLQWHAHYSPPRVEKEMAE